MFNYTSKKIALTNAAVVGINLSAMAVILFVCVCRMANVGQALPNAVGYTTATLVEYYWSYMLPEYYHFVVELIGFVVGAYIFIKIIEDARRFDDDAEEEA